MLSVHLIVIYSTFSVVEWMEWNCIKIKFKKKFYMTILYNITAYAYSKNSVFGFPINHICVSRFFSTTCDMLILIELFNLTSYSHQFSHTQQLNFHLHTYFNNQDIIFWREMKLNKYDFFLNSRPLSFLLNNWMKCDPCRCS